ncbi:MAG: hypothetical protein OXC68_00935, partial [Aestuariivita sp.]|nr:hypothetical protein [Aestuariivita sp.]
RTSKFPEMCDPKKLAGIAAKSVAFLVRFLTPPYHHRLYYPLSARSCYQVRLCHQQAGDTSTAYQSS